ncbi:recombinase RecT, partial [Acetobacter sicerae]|uniref:recombinase RecT n=1 Tax=Acetobacter sicerae TaxID=85325 RepID=UPI00156ACFBA
RLDYDFSGVGDSRKVFVMGRIKGEAKDRTVEVLLKDARTTNEWWTKTPDQMLAYHGARVWARRHTPEVMLGVYSPEEFSSNNDRSEAGPAIDITPASHQVQQQKPVDHLAIWTNRLKQCGDGACCDMQWSKWDETIQKAEAAGRPIAAETCQAVFDMIADRRADFAEPEQSAPLEVLPA